MKLKPALATTVATAMALTMLPRSASAHTPSASRYSDAQIAQGILYGEGPFAQHAGIRPLSTAKAPSVTEIHAVENRLLQTIQADSPQQFTQAMSEVRTGNPYAVDDGLKQLSKQLSIAMKKDYPSLTNVKAVPNFCGIICVCVAVVEAAVAGGAAVVLVVETAVGGHFVLWTKSKVWNSSIISPEGDDIGYQDYVAKIASSVR